MVFVKYSLPWRSFWKISEKFQTSYSIRLLPFFLWEQEKCRFILFRVLKQVSFISFSFDIGEIGSRRGRWTRRERNDRIVIAFALRY